MNRMCWYISGWLACCLMHCVLSDMRLHLTLHTRCLNLNNFRILNADIPRIPDSQIPKFRNSQIPTCQIPKPHTFSNFRFPCIFAHSQLNSYMSNILRFPDPDSQIPKFLHILQFPDSQILKFPDSQIPRFTNSQILTPPRDSHTPRSHADSQIPK